MRLKSLVVGFGVLGLLLACSSGDDGGGGSSVVGNAGSAVGGSAGSSGGGLMLGESGGGAGGAGGISGGGAGGTAGSAGGGGASAGGGFANGGAGIGGSGGRPPSAAPPTGWTIYFCLGDGCPHGGCSGGAEPSCDQLWGSLTPETPLCDPEKKASYCLVTDKGTWVIDCAESEAYVQECPGNCATAGDGAYCNG